MTVDLRGTDIFGHTIVEFIGEGGMASVWRAEHPALGSEVAVKALDPVLAKDASLVERFMDEARIQVQLQHPNIVKVQNFSTDPLAMVMEFIPGRPLSQVIGREVGPIPIQRAMPMIRQILSAVEYAHSMGVVHRDLKPSNILVTPEGAIRVMDFGIAKVLGAQGRTRTGASMGTPAYMAPEQIKGAKNVDARADLYALGVTIYEMLCGRVPFEAEQDTDSDFMLMQAQVHQDPPNPQEFYPGIPNPVVAVVLKALAKDPAARQQSVAELLEELERATGERHHDPDLPDMDNSTVVENPAQQYGAPDVSGASPVNLAKDIVSTVASGASNVGTALPTVAGANMGLIGAIVAGAVVVVIGVGVVASTGGSNGGGGTADSGGGITGGGEVETPPPREPDSEPPPPPLPPPSSSCSGYDANGKPASCSYYKRASSPRLQVDDAHYAIQRGDHSAAACIAFDAIDRLEGSNHKYRYTYTSGAAYNIALVLHRAGCKVLACKWIRQAFDWRMLSPRHGSRYISAYCTRIPEWGCGEAPYACR